ncbi:MAG: cation:proton antiporter [Candidatus Bathyarchaeota archaeon]|nr:cation:proton antiporter [Candidatus Bathyarchaeota archaeon]
MDPVTLALILGGAIIVIGFLGNYFFERTGFPDMFFLVILGMLFGPITGLVDTSSIMGLAPYLAALALVFILFDGGIAMNIYNVFTQSPIALVLAVTSFGVSVAATTFFMIFVVIPDVPLLYSVLFGTILGGSSSIVVISLASRLKVSEKCSTILSLESAITDILCIVFSLVVIEILLKNSAVDWIDIGQSIASRFSIGIVLGGIFGFLWLGTLKKVAKASYAYMLTLGVVLLSYAISESLGGSGSLCALVFGIMLGNEKEIYQMLKLGRLSDLAVDAGLRKFESEIAFLLRTFFFVYIGLIVTISSSVIVAAGVLLSFLLLLVRVGAVRLATVRCDELENEKPIMDVMMARGLAAAVLATLPLQYADPIRYPTVSSIFQALSPLYVNLTAIVILTTAMITTAGIPLLNRVSKKRSRKSKGYL